MPLRISYCDHQKSFGLTGAFNVDEIHVVSGSVDHCPESHRISHLTVEPDVLISREEPCQLGSNDSNEVTEHGNEDEAAIVSQN
jgi:hypothetical protein